MYNFGSLPGSTMLFPLVFCLCLGALSALPDEFRSNFEFLGYNTNLDEPQYRLRDSVQPIEQYVDLDVYLEEARMDGLVEITVQVSIFF